MNTERVMEVIAEELGVEFGEKFKIKGSTNHCDFFISSNGLYYEPLDRSFGYAVAHDLHLIDLISGSCDIEKLPWEPKDREWYFYPSFERDEGVNLSYWHNDTVDNRIKDAFGIYKTYEEALEKSKELGWI